MDNMYVLERFAKDHQEELLREAQADRLAAQVEHGNRERANLLKRCALLFGGMLTKSAKKQDQSGISFTDRAYTDA